MSSVGELVSTWGPVLIKYLPRIIEVAKDIYALWCDIKHDKRQNNTVLKSMKLLDQHRDDIDGLLQNQEKKEELLEGLTVLINKINEHDRIETDKRDRPSVSTSRKHFLLPASNASKLVSSSPASMSTHTKDGWKSFYGGGASDQSLTLEHQIERAIKLSQQKAQSHGSSYVETKWQEVLEAEDKIVATASQESDIHKAS